MQCIHFIYSKCHIKQLRVGKSRKTCLTNHAWSIYIYIYICHTISSHCLLIPSGADTQTHRQTHRHTDTDTDTHTHRHMNQSNFKKPWFKNFFWRSISLLCIFLIRNIYLLYGIQITMHNSHSGWINGLILKLWFYSRTIRNSHLRHFIKRSS